MLGYVLKNIKYNSRLTSFEKGSLMKLFGFVGIKSAAHWMANSQQERFRDFIQKEITVTPRVF